jgi:hypothetical protein
MRVSNPQLLLSAVLAMTGAILSYWLASSEPQAGPNQPISATCAYVIYSAVEVMMTKDPARPAFNKMGENPRPPPPPLLGNS